MKSTKGKHVDAIPRSRKDGSLYQEKHARIGNPVELTRVKLQDPIRCIPDGISSSMWSSDGIMRPSRLYQRSNSTPPTHAAMDLPTFGKPREGTKPGMQQSCHLSGSSNLVSASTNEDNQVGTDGGDCCTSETIGVDIQRSWSAPPNCEQDGALGDNQDEGSVPLRLVHFNSTEFTSDAHCTRENETSDIWGKHAQTFEKCNLLRGSTLADISPLDSPDPSDTQVLSDLSFGSALGYSNQGSNGSGSACSVASSHEEYSAEACRVPPGMSLIDRIQEDFPRTSSPVYGSVPVARDRTSFARDTKPISTFDALGSMERMRIDDRMDDRHGAIARESKCKLDDIPCYREDSRDFPSLERFQQSRALTRSTSQSAYSTQTCLCKAPYAFQPQLPFGHHGHPLALDQAKLQWSSGDVYYPGAAAFEPPATELGFASTLNQRLGSKCQTKRGGVYGAVKASDRSGRAHSYLSAPVSHAYDACDGYQNGIPRSNVLYRSKPGSNRRSEREFLHPAAHSYTSSSLLEEFNSAAKSDKWELSAIKGHLLLFARDQSGSRFIQQRLERADDQTKDDAFDELYPNAHVLMTDVFGNYVIQKFFEHGSLKQQQLLVEEMKTNLLSLALQVYGCRVIQRALEVTQVAEQLALIAELRGHVMKCITDQNGNHVLQKCIEAASWKKSAEAGGGLGTRDRVTGEDIQFIVDDVLGHAAALSTHSYGCRVIQRILEHCSPAQIRPILNEIIFKCRDLVKDQFGNYVVQHIISHGEPDQKRVVMDAVFPEIGRWSQHKYASNVVEACLDHASKTEIARTIDAILRCDESGSPCPLLPMMKHMYGNYVVQKLLDKADPRDRQRIVCIIQHNADYLKRFTFGKHVLSRLEREHSASFY